jgi:predicted dehydrogenase
VSVVGAGVFGRNHLRVYRELERAGYPVELAGVIDPNESARAAAAQYGVPGYATIAEWVATERVDRASGGPVTAASVCVPTMHHAACACELMAAGVDVLIEKPLAANLAEADSIASAAREHGLMVQVGHLERFNPAVTAVQGLLHRPMFFEVHRLSVFTPRSLDVDVVLDLMIHDLDIVLSLVQSPVREVRAVGLAVLSKKVDIANVRIEFENGCIANFTASRVSTERVRKLRFFQPHQYLSLDFARQDLLMIDVAGMAGMGREKLAAMEAGQHPSEGLSLRNITVPQGEPLRLEIAAFLDAVRTRAVPVVSAKDGRAALGLALEITRAIEEHATRAGL